MFAKERAASAAPCAAGSYALLLHAGQTETLTVGALGKLTIERGTYLYVGSAFGPGGLAARLAHHLEISRRPHWHIDYLRQVTQPLAVWWTTDPRRREHDWAALLIADAQAASVSPRFGASDCRCKTHLVFYRECPHVNCFVAAVLRAHPDHGAITAMEF